MCICTNLHLRIYFLVALHLKLQLKFLFNGLLHKHLHINLFAIRNKTILCFSKRLRFNMIVTHVNARPLKEDTANVLHSKSFCQGRRRHELCSLVNMPQQTPRAPVSECPNVTECTARCTLLIVHKSVSRTSKSSFSGSNIADSTLSSPES